jgi:hypothetical protein
MRAALGFRPHSGWTTVVALGDDGGGVALLERRRLDLIDATLPRQMYHAAAALGLEGGAAELVRRAERNARDTATHAVGSLIADLRRDRGVDVVAVGLPAGKTRVPTELATVLRSHPLLHAAEGELYREVLGGACDLPVHLVEAHELGEQKQARRERLAELGRAAGPPWRQDEKDATICAWLALDRAV